MTPEVQWEWNWSGMAAVLGVVFSLTLLASVIWTTTEGWRRYALASIKALAVTLLLACLLNPTKQVIEPKPGENLLLVAVDQSRSLDLNDEQKSSPRRQAIQSALSGDQAWLNQLEDDYNVQYFGLGEQLKVVDREKAGQGTDTQSPLFTQTLQLAERFKDRSVAGIVVVTDGLATDSEASDTLNSTSPDIPVFPVIFGDHHSPLDLSLEEVRANPTNFETTPLLVTAKISHVGLGGRTVVVALLDQNDTELVQQRTTLPAKTTAEVTLEVPNFAGLLNRYRVIARLEDEIAGGEITTQPPTKEATLLNNHQRLMVPREGGPFRILYVAGRPNWEFKFLRRAAQEDPEINVVGLLRLAEKEPRFAFLDRSTGSRNPLFDGFNATTPEETAEYDEPVLVRLGTETEDELMDGFPKVAEELFTYSAIILDDVDAKFFTQNQLDLIKLFVDRRGGGLLMLGGPQGFDRGGFDRSSLSDILPVYPQTEVVSDSTGFRLGLTREGWLQSWTRLRDTQDEETVARASMPDFQSINRVPRVKPGALLIGTLNTSELEQLPGLATHTYGRGRAAALMIGDLFRWKLQTPADNPLLKKNSPMPDAPPDDFGQSWRQLLRWLVADLPTRLSAESRFVQEPIPSREILLNVQNLEYLPDDSASVELSVTYPDGTQTTEAAKWTLTQGQYRALVPLQGEGFYEVVCTATDRNGELIEERTLGWTWEPTGDEYRELVLEKGLWETFAEANDGTLIPPTELASIEDRLRTETLPEKNVYRKPLWHQWPILLIAVTLLTVEWGWRRWIGLA
ncbi:MAG: hypothetical protein VYE28_02640 [Planctomycetota bacterium]|nr:hypothetical protein [Planctomycetota bacterium]